MSRGYGRSAGPAEIESYAMTALVGDVVAVIDDLGVEQAVVVGHDWGAPIAWNTALLRPERVSGWPGCRFPTTHVSTFGPWPLCGPGPATRSSTSTTSRPRAWPRPRSRPIWPAGSVASTSPRPVRPIRASRPMGMVTPGGQLRDRLQQPGPGQMAWMTEEDFAFYLGEFERTGLTGGLNRYRNIERDWTELAAWRHAPIRVPALFIGGDRDGPTQLGRKAIERFDQTLPALTRSEILAGCGHWTQQERPDEVNHLLLEFVAVLG